MVGGCASVRIDIKQGAVPPRSRVIDSFVQRFEELFGGSEHFLVVAAIWAKMDFIGSKTDANTEPCLSKLPKQFVCDCIHLGSNSFQDPRVANVGCLTLRILGAFNIPDDHALSAHMSHVRNTRRHFLHNQAAKLRVSPRSKNI